MKWAISKAGSFCSAIHFPENDIHHHYHILLCSGISSKKVKKVQRLVPQNRTARAMVTNTHFDDEADYEVVERLMAVINIMIMMTMMIITCHRRIMAIMTGCLGPYVTVLVIVSLTKVNP